MRGGGGGVGPAAERVSEARAQRVTYRANTLLGKWRRRETAKEGAKNEVSTCDGERGQRTIWRRSTAHSFWAKLKGPFLSLINGPTLSPLQPSIVSPLKSIEEVPSEIMKYCRVSFFSSSIHKRLGLGACVRACTKQASAGGKTGQVAAATRRGRRRETRSHFR